MTTWYVFVNKHELEDKGLSIRGVSGRGPYAFSEFGLIDTHWYSPFDTKNTKNENFCKMRDNSDYALIIVSGN